MRNGGRLVNGLERFGAAAGGRIATARGYVVSRTGEQYRAVEEQE